VISNSTGAASNPITAANAHIRIAIYTIGATIGSTVWE
jgi:hypothetical protein